MSVKLTITRQMEEIAREHGKILAPLRDDLVLLDSGLDSLGFAVLVARLEDKLGVDPFTASEEADVPRDFRRLREGLRKWRALNRHRCDGASVRRSGSSSIATQRAHVTGSAQRHRALAAGLPNSPANPF